MRRFAAAFVLAALPLASSAQTGRVELNLAPLDAGWGARAAVQTGLPGVSPFARPVALSAPALSSVFAPKVSPKVLPVSFALPVSGEGKKLPAPESEEKGWTPRDLDRVFDFSKAPPAHSSDLDMPGAGSGELSADDVAWMRGEMVEGPNPIFSKEGFAYMVEGDPVQTQVIQDAMRAGQRGLLSNILDVMYQSLLRTVESDNPNRMAVAEAAARRYAAVLELVGADQAITPATRALASRAIRLFLNDDVLIEELARARQARHDLGKLEQRARGFLSAQSAAEVPSSSGKWSMPELIPESDRVRDAQDIRFPLSLTKIAAEIEAAEFNLEKLSARYYAAARKGLSETLVGRLYDDFNAHLSSVLSWLPNAYSNVTRFPLGTLRKHFSSQGKAHLVLRIPDNKNLRMTAEPGGFLVTAHFETDIQDAAVLAMIKKSIEDYWRGIFELKDGAKHFRTVVTFKTLAAGEDFSEGSLQLADGKDTVSNVAGDRLTLGRAWSYDTPAHEFGHILGLADEYQELYDPAKRATDNIMPANLMGSYPNAVVLSRHFKTAYLLLKRHSLGI